MHFHEAVEIHIGGQTRSLVFTPKAMKTASQVLKQDPRDALAAGGEHTIFVLTACGFLHAEGDRVDEKRVCAWVTHEPACFVPLLKALGEAVRRYYVTLGVLHDDEGPKAGASTSSP